MDLQALDNLAGDYSSFLSPRVLATNGGKVIDREQQIPVGSSIGRVLFQAIPVPVHFPVLLILPITGAVHFPVPFILPGTRAVHFPGPLFSFWNRWLQQTGKNDQRMGSNRLHPFVCLKMGFAIIRMVKERPAIQPVSSRLFPLIPAHCTGLFPLFPPICSPL